MPVIAPHYFNVRLSDVSGDTYSYKSVVSVTSRGVFAMRIPSELIPACEELAKSEHGVTVEKGKAGTAVHAYDKTRAIDLIEKAIVIYAKAETTKEIVIVYEHEAEGIYIVGPKGEIATDGYDANVNFGRAASGGISSELLKGGWGWSAQDHNHFGNRSVMKFGIGAQVYEKTTIKRATGTSIMYDLYWGEDGDHFSRTTYCQRLNSFMISFDLGGRGSNEHSRHKEIPYTEEGARFFFKAMIGLCSLNERVKNFFGDSKSLQLAIESRSARLLG
jgi:hypothetical protein